MSNILLTEVASGMLIHLSGSDVVGVSVSHSRYVLSDKDLKTMQYLAGFAVHKPYVKCDDEFNKQVTFILFACKVDHDSFQTYLKLGDKGSLWKVNKGIRKVFIQCEKIFRAQTHTSKTSVDFKAIVAEMLQNNLLWCRNKCP